MKPMLASDWDESKIRFPLLAQPKVDGVRALNMVGKLTGRSLKPFKNKFVTAKFGHSTLLGLDGEMAANHECHPDLCRLTSSALGTITGEPFVLWWLFDYIRPDTAELPYNNRLEALQAKLANMKSEGHPLAAHLRMMPTHYIRTKEELDDIDAKFLAAGYEGTIVRDPFGVHKQGRSTAREGGLLRIKRFLDFEFRVAEVLEGEENQNEAQINELGQTFRTSHQANKVANGMVGAMEGYVVSDVRQGQNLVLRAGQLIKVGAGRMTHDQRKQYFEDQDALKSMVCKGKFFPIGIKDKPRFPTWQSFRMDEDMS